MAAKCTRCEYGDISDVLLYDCLVQKCGKCGYVRVSVGQYSELLYKVMYSLDVGQIRSYTDAGCISPESAKEIGKFIMAAELDSFRLSRLEAGECDVCRTGLSELRNRYYSPFSGYYCIGCNSVYFSRDEFLEFVRFLDKARRPLGLRWLIREIFHLK